ncbi:hypothetical protein [Rhodoblastus sp.]|jgi:hypothetical protein|uniref:hypothetical protein n=1 Tax=Rhodoblastus sp. TaxID=1962975 RepID=UPI0025FD229F|nr:hypothetical protein [Rhodoblastus sp.]
MIALECASMGDLGQLLELTRLENGGEIEKLEVMILKLLNDGVAEPATQRWLAERLNYDENSKSGLKFIYRQRKLGEEDHKLEGHYLIFDRLYCDTKHATKTLTAETVDEIVSFRDRPETAADKIYKHIRIFKGTPT